VTPFETGQLALFAWREGGKSEQVATFVAIAKVLSNRAEAGWHRGSLYSNIILQSANRPPTWHCLWPELGEPVWQQLLQLLEGLDKLPDMTDGGLYYVGITDEVGLEAVKDATRTSQVGSFLFFK
jgi:hypothetical protein